MSSNTLVRRDIYTREAFCCITTPPADSSFNNPGYRIADLLVPVYVETRFDGFSVLPIEIKNEIYRLLLVTKRPIKLKLSDYEDPHVWSWAKKKYCLSAQILRTNKHIYAEALRVLLSENTFQLNNDSVHYINHDFGKGTQQAPAIQLDHASLVRKVIIQVPRHMRRTLVATLHKLTNLEMLVLVDEDGCVYEYDNSYTTAQLRRLCADRVRSVQDAGFWAWLRTYSKRCEYVAYQKAKDPGRPANMYKMYAFRWKAELLSQGGATRRLILINESQYEFTDWQKPVDVLRMV